MPSRAAHSFSLAMVELAQERSILEPVKTAAEELLQNLRIPELHQFLSHPKIPDPGKKEVLSKLVSADVPREFVNFLNLIVDRHRVDALVPTLESLIDLTLKIWGNEIVELISAMPLSETEQQRISQSLSQAWGKKIYLKYRVNAGLIGGVVIRRGDQMIDGSLSGQIHSLKNLLLEKTELSI